MERQTPWGETDWLMDGEREREVDEEREKQMESDGCRKRIGGERDRDRERMRENI